MIKYKLKPHVYFDIFCNETIIADVKTEFIGNGNAVMGRILEQLDQFSSSDEIGHTLRKEYRVGKEKIGISIQKVLHWLVEKNLVDAMDEVDK